MRTLLLFLISFSVMGAYKAPISEVEKKLLDCSYPLAVSVSCSGACVEIKKSFKCETHELVDQMIDDPSSPIYEAKSNVVSCLDEADCLTKEAAQVCDSQNGYFVVRVADNSEVYCTKLLGYNQMLSGSKVLQENAIKKSAHELNELTAQAEKNALDERLKDMEFGKKLYASVQLINESKGLNKGQRRQLRSDLAIIRDDLIDGNICDARADIVGLVADGTLIRTQDKTAVLAKIDAYKLCP